MFSLSGAKPEAVAGELGAKPMPMLPAQRIALAELGGQRIAWNAVQDQRPQGGQQLCVGLALPRVRVRPLSPLYGRQQAFYLVHKQRVCVKRPAMTFRHRLQRHLALDRCVRIYLS